MSRIVYGKRAVEEALRHSPGGLAKLYLDSGKRQIFKPVADLARSLGLEPLWVSHEEIDKVCRHTKHQGIAAMLADFQFTSVKDFVSKKAEKARVAVALDSVTDPQNLGACLRAAGAFGADLVVIPERRSATITPVVSKASAGATEVVAVAREVNLTRALQSLKQNGFWIYGLDPNGAQPLSAAPMNKDVVLVLGSEGSGLHRLVAEQCDYLVHLSAAGPIESLNVAQACAVGLYEIFRRRAEQAATP